MPPITMTIALTVGDKASADANFGIAETYYRRAVELSANSSEAWNKLAIALGGARKFEEALSAHYRAIAIDPMAAGSYNGLGVTLCASGDIDSGIAKYRKAIQLNPGVFKYYYNLGLALNWINDLDKAAIELKHAVQLLPSVPEQKDALSYELFILGSKFYNESSFPKAAEVYRTIITYDPKAWEAYYWLGHCLMHGGELAAAEETFQTFLRDASGDPGLMDLVEDVKDHLAKGIESAAEKPSSKAHITSPSSNEDTRKSRQRGVHAR